MRISSEFRLFAVSFLSIFFELAFIRWSAAHVPLMAYFVNLTLLSCFFGLSLGYILSQKKLDLVPFFPVFIFCNTALAALLKGFDPVGFSTESLFFLFPKSPGASIKNLVIVLAFAMISAIFVPLGQAIGREFDRLPKLRAYSINLIGAFSGGLCFSAFALFSLPAVAWFAAGFVAFTLLISPNRRLHALLLFAASLGLMMFLDRGDTHWSPYNRLKLEPLSTNALPGFPQGHTLFVNRYVYQFALSQRIDSEDLKGPEAATLAFFKSWAELYRLPYTMTEGGRVLVAGCGTGNDVAAALLNGRTMVDAVDIDPIIVEIGVKHHPNRPYDHPGVRLHIRDARAYFRSSPAAYDLIVFGFLDSQSLFSHMANVRLDGFVYTVESFQEARRLLRPGGHLVVQFVAVRPWLTERLYTTLHAAFPEGVAAYILRGEGTFGSNEGFITLVAGPIETLHPPPAELFAPLDLTHATAEPATDDWPFLYLKDRTIPREYLFLLGLLFLLGAIAVGAAVPSLQRSARGPHFFFLGAGFMILETRAITRLSLVFGSGWISTLAIVSLILIVLWMANMIALRRKALPLTLAFSALLLSVGLLAWADRFVPAASQSWGIAMAVAGAYSLPFFIAGLVFSGSFRLSTKPSQDLGWNAIGAILGGSSEYCAMVLGLSWLQAFALVYYLLAWILMPRSPSPDDAAAGAPSP